MSWIVRKISNWLFKVDQRAPSQNVVRGELADVMPADNEIQKIAAPRPVYDEFLYERVRTRWQFGDWKALTGITYEEIQYHPEKAKLALMVAAGHLQSNDVGLAKKFIAMARNWGCSKKLVSRMLIAGVHNSLARASLVAGDNVRAMKHFEGAIATGTPGTDMRLIAQARITEQQAQLGLDRTDVQG